MIPLWDVQEPMVRDVRVAFRTHRSVLLVGPTGCGKTVMFCYIARNHVARGGRVLILVHRQELTEQVSDTLYAFNQEHGFIAAGFPNRQLDVNIASVFTLARRKDQIDWTPTLIIVDEAHHAVSSTTWGQVLAHYPTAHILGVTATPIRLSGEGLGESFECMVRGPTTQDLIDRGYLSRFRTFCPIQPDLTGVRRKMGDFVTKDLAQRIDRPSITGDAVEHYRAHAWGRQAVAFCVSVEHAHHVASQFQQAGLQAACIDGSMPSEWRRQMVADFKHKRLKLLASCDLISEGFDCPGIEVGISLRPTQSLGLVRQQLGRCLRTAPGKEEAIFLDAAGNFERHSLLDYDAANNRVVFSEPAWTLNGRCSRQSEEGGSSVRVCSKCWAAMASHCRRCLACGFEFPVIPRKVAKKKGKLEEMTSEQLQEKLRASIKAQEVGKTNSLAALEALGKQRGYKDPKRWAEHVFAGKQAKKARISAEQENRLQKANWHRTGKQGTLL